MASPSSSNVAANGGAGRSRSSSRVCERQVRSSSTSGRNPSPYEMVGSDLQEARTSTREASPHVAHGNAARSRSPQGRTQHAELAGGMMQNQVVPTWIPQAQGDPHSPPSPASPPHHFYSGGPPPHKLTKRPRTSRYPLDDC